MFSLTKEDLWMINILGWVSQSVWVQDQMNFKIETKRGGNHLSPLSHWQFMSQTVLTEPIVMKSRWRIGKKKKDRKRKNGKIMKWKTLGPICGWTWLLPIELRLNCAFDEKESCSRSKERATHAQQEKVKKFDYKWSANNEISFPFTFIGLSGFSGRAVSRAYPSKRMRTCAHSVKMLIVLILTFEQ